MYYTVLYMCACTVHVASLVRNVLLVLVYFVLLVQYVCIKIIEKMTYRLLINLS